LDRALRQDDASPPADSESVLPAAEARWETMKQAWSQAQQQLTTSQQRMAVAADRHRRALHFQVGDLVLLSTEHLQLRDESTTRKLAPLFCGPFPIKKIVNSNAYELELPALFKIHPVINVSQLREYRDGRTRFPERPLIRDRPPPDAVDSNGQEEYEVERILAHKGAGAAGLRYLVLWKGYGYEEATWEPMSSLKDAKEKIKEYRKEQEQLPQRKKARRGTRSNSLSAKAVAYAPAPKDLTNEGIEQEHSRTL
jgi:hypothetical protein